MQILATCLTTSQFCCLPFCQIADSDKNVLSQVRSCLQPLFSSEAGGTILTPFPFNTHTHTHFFNVDTQPDGAGVQNLQFYPLAIVEDYRQTQRHFTNQFFRSLRGICENQSALNYFNRGAAFAVECCSAYLPARYSVVPICQSICAHGGIEKPIICSHLIHACNSVWYEESAPVGKIHHFWPAALPPLSFPPFFAYFVKVWSYRPVSSLLIENTEASQKKKKRKKKRDIYRHTFAPSLILQTFLIKVINSSLRRTQSGVVQKKRQRKIMSKTMGNAL